MSDKPIDGWWQAKDDRWYPPESHPHVATGAVTAPPGWVRDDSGRWIPPPEDVVPISVVHVSPGGRGLRAGSIALVLLVAAVVAAYSLSTSSKHQATQVAVRSRTEIRITTTTSVAPTTTPSSSGGDTAVTAPPSTQGATTNPVATYGRTRTYRTTTTLAKAKKKNISLFNPFSFLFATPTTKAPTAAASPSTKAPATTKPPTTIPPSRGAPTTNPPASVPPTQPPTTKPPTTTTQPPPTTEPPPTTDPPTTLPPITLPSIPGL